MANNKSDTMDKHVHNVLPIFATDLNRLPFRLLTIDEIIEVSGLTNHIQNIQAHTGPLDPRVVRNLCGNCFHPALIESALGSTEDLGTWMQSSDQEIDTQTPIPDPGQTLAKYQVLREEVAKELRRREGPNIDPDQKLAAKVPFPLLQKSNPDDHRSALSKNDMASKIQSEEHVAVPMHTDTKEQDCVQLSRHCKLHLISEGWDYIFKTVSLVGLPSQDLQELSDFFIYPAEQQKLKTYAQQLQEAYELGEWRTGNLHFLLSNILQCNSHHIRDAGILCFVENGIDGHTAYYGASCPRWLIFCHCAVATSSLSFITIQWTPYSTGFHLPIARVPYTYIHQRESDLDTARDVLAISVSPQSQSEDKTLLSSSGRLFTHKGCPCCVGSLLFPRHLCPVHCPQVKQPFKAVGILLESGHLSMSIEEPAPPPAPMQIDQGKPTLGFRGDQGQNAEESVPSHVRNDGKIVLFQVLLTHEVHQQEQWFNAGSVKTYICRSVHVTNAAKQSSQPLTQADWGVYVKGSKEQSEQIAQRFSMLHVWGTEALLSRVCHVRPPEAQSLL